ncbi:hypothetical protein KIN20_023954 [Parelaphostrongylus tenuis]|uniref:Uncharacterized protein n=1 Tax=Parelaphostrongylus tenuis TaxID=148309 RepID=A0AAD5MST2_PARTN|nr:hypothetical protein KIN20_023954 [Parelaphostrongylus tenuis]
MKRCCSVLQHPAKNSNNSLTTLGSVLLKGIEGVSEVKSARDGTHGVHVKPRSSDISLIIIDNDEKSPPRSTTTSNQNTLKGYFHDKQRVCIILEFAEDGDLYERMKRKVKWDEAKAAKTVFSLHYSSFIFVDESTSHDVIKKLFQLGHLPKQQRRRFDSNDDQNKDPQLVRETVDNLPEPALKIAITLLS